jgi:APA family basic amino acid/polyamine antiporter
MELRRSETQPVQAQLGLWDAVSIIVGIVIGSTIYRSPPLIMSNVSGPWVGLGVWALGGVLSLIGALCYAELASTYPRLGGDYVYLSRAFGPWLGFLFGWAQLAVILTSSIGAMAFVFAEYAVTVWPNFGPSSLFVYAFLAVAVLALMNILGVVLGKWTQNVLTAAKVLGLGAILWAGFQYGQPGAFAASEKPVEGPGIGLAMILVLYAYGGWNDAAFVVAEMRNKRRNIPLALILGTAGVTIIYLAVNAAYLQALGFEGVRQSSAVAADVLARAEPLSGFGSKAMSILVMISALGAINGLTFTGSRVYATLGAEHSVFAWLGRWNPQLGSPVWALVTQAVISLAMIAAVGTEAGQNLIDDLLRVAGLQPLPWSKYFGGFNTLVAGTAPVFWGFFLLTGLSLFALRERDRGIERPFSVPLFPVLPLIFCGTCFYMLYSAIDYAGKLTLIGIIPLLLGLPLYGISRRRVAPDEPPAAEEVPAELPE